MCPQKCQFHMDVYMVLSEKMVPSNPPAPLESFNRLRWTRQAKQL